MASYRSPKFMKTLKILSGFVSGTLVVSLFVFGFYFSKALSTNRVSTNVFVGDVEVKRGTDYDQAFQMVGDHYQNVLNQTMTIHVNGQPHEITPAEMGFSINPYKTIENIYLIEQANRNVWKTLQVSLLADVESTEPLEVEPVLEIDTEALTESIVDLLEEADDSETVTLEVGGTTVTVELESKEADVEEDAPPVDYEETLYEAPPEAIDPNSVHWSEISLPSAFTFRWNDGETDQEYKIRFTKDWLDYSERNEEGKFSKVQPELVYDYIQDQLASKIDIERVDAYITEWSAEGSDYVTVEGYASDGRQVLVDESFAAYEEAVDEGTNEAALTVEELPGRIIDQSGAGLPELTLLGEGYSNFATSPSGRAFNVRKGLNEKVHNIAIASGAEYDFNSNLGSVTYSAGWEASLAIFGGTNLVAVPGGGLCQVSTTAYRAGLDAGLPITEQYNHSLYVHYYVEGGDGLDATIFPGGKNLKFLNDTDDYLVIQAYDDGYDAYVKIYGVSDGRTTEMIGPFYPSSIPEEYQDRIWLSSNQIGWIRIVRDADGNIIADENRISSYRWTPYY